MAETTTSTRRSGHDRSTGRPRAALLGAALTASAVALVACGSDDEAAESSATRTAKPTPVASQSVTASAQSSQPPTASGEPTASASSQTPAPETVTPTAPLPIPSGSYATVWPAPAGTVPGRCGGNGMDGRMYLNGWELCWTEQTISQEFAVNVAQTLSVSNFAGGTYEVPSPSGMKTIECNSFLSPATQTTIISCSGGTITGNGAIELAWLG